MFIAVAAIAQLSCRQRGAVRVYSLDAALPFDFESRARRKLELDAQAAQAADKLRIGACDALTMRALLYQSAALTRFGLAFCRVQGEQLHC